MTHRFFYTSYLRRVAVLLSFCVLTSVFAQEQPDFQISLPNRVFTPKGELAASTIADLQQQLQIPGNPYYLLQFKAPPNRQERARLKAAGVDLVSFVGGQTWYVKISDEEVFNFNTSNDIRLNPIRWIGAIQKEDRIAPFLRENGIGEWAKFPAGKAKIMVDFFEGVSKEEARSILAKYNVEITAERRRRTGFDIIIDENDYLQLLEEPSLRWMRNYPAPYMEYNDGGKGWTNTIAVHNAGVDGSDVIIGIWDGDEVDNNHNDLNGRIIFGETPRTNITSEHATHVAGTIAGDGTGNANLNGHAPNSSLVSYGFLRESGTAVDYVPDEMDQAIEDHDIVIANNSWGERIGWDRNNLGTWVYNLIFPQTRFGNYIQETADFDEIVRNENLVIVFAAGNDRNDPTPSPGIPSATQPSDADQVLNAGSNNGYATMSTFGSGKNLITVGAINDANSAISTFSNWGPTDDGRIKPDIVAPGVNICSADDDANDTNAGGSILLNSCPVDDTDTAGGTDTNNGYTSKSGTSMAAPAVSGIAGLLIQAYREEFYGSSTVDEEPLASTIKSLMIHSAQDLGNVGPDFQFGWGGVDADAAYQLIQSRLFIESEFRDTDQEDIFLVEVPPGATSFNVTIAWDDVEGAVGCNPCLINDLDLWLENPDGTTFTPWQLNPAAGSWANAAVRHGGVDRINTVEQVSRLNPMAGVWKVHVRAFEVNAPADDPQQKYSLVSDFPIVLNESVSVVQVIDNTGSMDSYNYMEPAKTAAKNFIGLQNLGDEVGVVSFADLGCDNTGPKSQNVHSLSVINTEAQRDAAINSITAISADGCTSIGAGMELAQTSTDFLGGANPDQPHAMVLLTDGFENRTPWVRTRPDGYSSFPATPNNVLTSIPAKTKVFTVALGTTADTDLMEDIANTTGGKFYESPGVPGLLSIYYQIRSDIAATGMSELAVESQSETTNEKRVTVEKDARQVTFVTGWVIDGQSIHMQISDPAGVAVNRFYPGVSFSAEDGFLITRVNQPTSGEWSAKISNGSKAESTIDYTFAAFVKGPSLLTSLLPVFSRSGDCLEAKVQLKDERGNPITGATVVATLRSPNKSKYNLHYELVNQRKQDVSYKSPSLQGKAVLSTSIAENRNDPTIGWAQRLRTADDISLESTGQSIFQYTNADLTLFDNGTNGDERANDGVYTVCFPSTEVAGNYQLDFSITGAGNTFKRRMLATSVVKPAAIDVDKSIIEIVQNGADHYLLIVPRDRFGNLIGPGLAPIMQVTPSTGELIGDIRDEESGIYVQRIDPAAAKGPISVRVGGVELTTEREKAKFGISFHYGRTFPTGDLETLFDSGNLFELDAEYAFNNYLSLEGLLGRYEFSSDFEITGASLSLKGYLPIVANTRLYAALGGGSYTASNNSEFGIIGSAGLNLQLNNNFYLDGAVQYINVFTSPSSTSFGATKLGLKYFF